MAAPYDARWQRRRRRQLEAEPLCRMCAARGMVVAATVADHVLPHRGDPLLFEEGELQSLCASCHSADKQSMERTGRVRGCDADGISLDPAHWWRR